VVLEKEKEHGMIARWILVFVFLLPTTALADASVLILSGVAGSPEHAEKFSMWTEATRKVLTEKMGFLPDRVIVLQDRGTAIPEIQKAFATLKQQLKPLDSFFLIFIGHGSYDTDYKFNISGRDLTATEYNQLLSGLNVGRIVVVNATSASGGAIEALAGKNRIILTATRSGQEGNETVFYEHFLDALQNPASDEDKDSKTSVWEAFKYASAGVERFYKEEGRLATEHPQISDSGGAKTGPAVQNVPQLARTTTFVVDRPIVVSDPRLQALLNQRREIEQKIEALRLVRQAMPEADYERQMEDLLVDLALKNQQIRAQEGQK
jgi:hypothetical protein